MFRTLQQGVELGVGWAQLRVGVASGGRGFGWAWLRLGLVSDVYNPPERIGTRRRLVLASVGLGFVWTWLWTIPYGPCDSLSRPFVRESGRDHF